MNGQCLQRFIVIAEDGGFNGKLFVSFHILQKASDLKRRMTDVQGMCPVCVDYTIALDHGVTGQVSVGAAV